VGNRVASPSPERSVVVKLGFYETVLKEVELAALLTEFHRLHPRIQIQPFMIHTLNYHSVVKAYMETDMLDLVTMNYIDFQEFVENGNTDWLEEHEPNAGVYPFVKDAFVHQGRLLVQPYAFSPVILCYNRDHFRELKLHEPDSSWTWDDLISHAKKLAIDNERFGIYFNLFSRNRWPIFPLQSSETFGPDETGGRRSVGNRLAASFTLCRDLIYADNVFPVLLAASDTDAGRLFMQGKVSMLMTTYFSLNELRKSEVNFDIAPLPRLHNGNTLLLPMGIAVNGRSRVKEAAKIFVDFMLSYETQLKIRHKTLSIPSLKHAAEWIGDESIPRPSRFHMYREIIPTFRLLSELGLSSGEREQILREVKLYWSRLQNVETFVQQIEHVLGGRK
jgi:multiple sugar transport system substrate-binding protein